MLVGTLRRPTGQSVEPGTRVGHRHCPEARADFTMAIALAPENPAPYYERGLLNAFLLENELARSDMETAATLGHPGARAWLDKEEASIVTAPLERR